MPPTWLLVLLAVALVVAVLVVRDYEAEAHRRNVEPSIINLGAPTGASTSQTLAEANAERRAAGDVEIRPYGWADYWRERREDSGLVLALLTGSFGR
jgi:hypothetical protein